LQRRVRAEEVPLRVMIQSPSRPHQPELFSARMHLCSHSPQSPRSSVTTPSEMAPRAVPRSGLASSRRPEHAPETTARNMLGSGLVAARRAERDLQQQVQQISTSNAPRVASMSADPPLVRSRLRHPAISVDLRELRHEASVDEQSTASASVPLQSTEQSFESLAEGPEAGFSRRLAHVEQDLNQKLGKLVEVTKALSLMWDERFASLESRLSTNGDGVHPPSGSVASVDAPNTSQLHGKLLDLQRALPLQDFRAESTELREKLCEQRVEFERAFEGLRSDFLLLNFKMEELRVPRKAVEAPSVTNGSDGRPSVSSGSDRRVALPEKGRSAAAPVSQPSCWGHPLVRAASARIHETTAQDRPWNLSHSTRNLRVQPTVT